MRKGYIQVYTGDGKGKTTAALGLALRAAGAGLKVFMAQFIKKRRCSEHQALKRFEDLITVRQYGCGLLKGAVPAGPDIDAAKKGLEEIRDIIASKEYDMVILDEINTAAHYKLISVEDVLNLLNAKPSHMEMILTGRYCDDKIIGTADLVTEMKGIRHYFKKGVKARKGIEY